MILLAFLTPPRPAHAQTLQWATRWSGHAIGNDNLFNNHCMTVDAAGNTYITGSTTGSDGVVYVFTAKYDTNGNELWSTPFRSPGSDLPLSTGIAVDTRGNCYTIGYTYNDPVTLNRISLFTVKYTPTGVQRWVQYYRTAVAGNNVDPVGVAVNPAQPDSVYVIGDATGVATSTSGHDFIVLRYDVENGARRWLGVFDRGTGISDNATGFAVDTQGNCFVTGYAVPGNTQDQASFETVKFAAADGSVVWSQPYTPSTSPSRPVALALDPASGAVYVTGTTRVSLNQSGIEDTDFVTLKYDPSGTVVWDARASGTFPQGDSPTAIAVDPSSGDPVVTGYSYSGAPSMSNRTGYDYLTVKYDKTTGVADWTQHYDDGITSDTTSRDDRARGLVIDNVGAVYITGSTPANVVTIKYNHAGTVQWVRVYPARGGGGIAVALDSQGSVLVGANVISAANSLDAMVLKYTPTSTWSCQDIAVGADNKTRFLWNRSDGAIALWTVTAAGTIEKSNVFGPYAGLTARAIALGSDNKVRLLWDGGAGQSGKATVWTVKADLSGVESGYNFTAAGFTPWEIAVSPTDNLPRITWYDAANRVAVWTLNSSGTVSKSALFNAPTGYIDQAIAVGADNRIRLVWNKYGADVAALWTLNATTLSTIDMASTYGPLSPAGSGWLVRDIATGADNKPRLLWTTNINQVALWQISAGNSNTIEKGISFAPLPQPGWHPDHLTFSGGTGSDGNVRMLWSADSGSVLLYTVNPTTGAVVTTTGFGPL